MIKNAIPVSSISKNFSLQKCKIHIMSPTITDADITALFNGIVNVVKKKVELETKAEFLNMNIHHNQLLKQLKSKQAECVRLKNEILFLKSQLGSQQR